MSRARMSRVVISNATVGDAYALAPVMRQADRAELVAAQGQDPLDVLLGGLQTSTETWAAWVDGAPLAMWGVVDVSQSALGLRLGVAWLITGECIERHKREFWRACVEELGRLLEQWDVLVNWIDCRHEKAIRWAERLGFRLEDAAPYGAAGLPFRRFFVSKEDLCVDLRR